MDHIAFIYSSDDGHLSCFHPLPIVDNATMNMAVHVPIQVPAFHSFLSILRHGIAVFWDKSMFNFLKNCHNVLHSSCTILHPYLCIFAF